MFGQKGKLSLINDNMAIYAENLPKNTLLQVRELGKANSKWINDLITKGLNKIKNIYIFLPSLAYDYHQSALCIYEIFLFFPLFFFFQQTEEAGNSKFKQNNCQINSAMGSSRSMLQELSPQELISACYKLLGFKFWPYHFPAL